MTTSKAKIRFITVFMDVFGSNSRKVLWCSGVFFVLMFAFHIYKSISTGNYNWLAAYGALITIYSLIFSFCHHTYPSFKQDVSPGSASQQDAWAPLEGETGHAVGDFYVEDAEEVNAYQLQKTYKKYFVSILIYCLSIVGTLLWAYSSLLFGS